MKKIATLFIAGFLSFGIIHAQHFVADLHVLPGNVAAFYITPTGGDITDKLSTLAFYIRWPKAEGNGIIFDNFIVNTTDFPGLGITSVNNYVTDTSYNNQYFYYTGLTTSNTWNDGINYEVFRVTMGGTLPTYFELVANTVTYDPYWFLFYGEYAVNYSPDFGANPFKNGIDGGGGLYYQTYPAWLPLPVTLKSFDGSVENCKAFLKWTTVSEVSNKYFEVQSSRDGITFFPGAIIPAKGNYTDESYSYVATLGASYNYFRLKMVSKDESVKYSDIVLLNSKDCAIVSSPLVKVFPNPVIDHTIELMVSNAKEGTVQIQVVNASGVVIQSGIQKLVSGDNHLRLQLPFIMKGIYMVNMKAENGSSLGSQKIIVR